VKHSVEEIRLKNGARGLLIDVPEATTMSMQFQFRAGNRYAKSKEIEQVAHIMEHMSFGANSKYNTEQFEYEFTKNGAYRNAFTSDFSMEYVAGCADFEWDRILDLQLLAISHPKFTEEELNSEKGNVRSELTNYLNNYQRILWPRVAQLLGEDVFTYRQSLQTIPNISVSDIREHHRRTHTTGNMRFVIAGKLHGRKTQIRKMIDDIELPRGERFEEPRDTIVEAEPALIRRKDATNLTFAFAMGNSRLISDDELDAIRQLNHILTGTFHSRIFGKAREKGLAYDISAYSNTSSYDSAWDITGQVNHESAGELFDLIARELNNVLNQKLTDKELDAAKSFALGRYQMGAQTVSQISDFYNDRYFKDGFIKNYEKVPDMIKKVTKERMVDTARSFFDENKWTLVVVSSQDKQEVLDLSDKLSPLFKKS
jgi:predicted Zn-dependent peptidase